MLKRIKIGKHLEAIISEMCQRVGTKLESVNILEKDWQEKHEWTIDEEIKFQEWLFQYLVQNKEALPEISTYRTNEPVSAIELKNLTKEFTLFYGWALEEKRNFEYIKENKPKEKN
jgi:hypothetical protein